MWVQLCAIFAFIGGLLGTYLALQGANDYGNYVWDGALAPVASILLAVSFAGWFLVYQELIARGWLGFAVSVIGLLSMTIGYLVPMLWFLIFIGPLILVPIGMVMLGLNSTRMTPLPAWWRYFPLLIAAIALLGFGIEMWEEVVLHNSVPDRGLQTAQLLFSMSWLGLGVGLWLTAKRSTSQPGVM
jgi:hypothetical protein